METTQSIAAELEQLKNLRPSVSAPEKYEIEISWNEHGVPSAKFSGGTGESFTVTPAPAEAMIAKNFINRHSPQVAKAAA